MPEKIGAYPKRGVDLRNFIKSVKTQNTDKELYEKVKWANKGGLYYFSKGLQPSETKRLGKDPLLKNSVKVGADAQVKIGAAGLKGKSKKGDEDYRKGASNMMARNKIPGRLQMYVGHQGIANPKLHGIRTMPYGKVVNGKNSNIDESEKAMKRVMANLARPSSQGGHPGVDVANQAYTLDEGNSQEQQKREKKEWYVVDWDEKHPRTGVSTHQAITMAMGQWQPTGNAIVKQFQIGQGKPTTVPQPTERPAPRFNFPTMTPVAQNLKRQVDLNIPGSDSRAAKASRHSLSQITVKIKNLREQLLKEEKALWKSRQSQS